MEQDNSASFMQIKQPQFLFNHLFTNTATPHMRIISRCGQKKKLKLNFKKNY